MPKNKISDYRGRNNMGGGKGSYDGSKKTQNFMGHSKENGGKS